MESISAAALRLTSNLASGARLLAAGSLADPLLFFRPPMWRMEELAWGGNSAGWDFFAEYVFEFEGSPADRF
jgi:hypothetical protein